MGKTAIYLLSLYQKVKNLFFRPCCRYYPTCSEYAIQAIKTYGLFGGTYLASKRLIRCNQFFPGGYDPMPEKN